MSAGRFPYTSPVSDQKLPETKYTLLHWGWRCALLLVGVAMVAASVLVYTSPPLRWSTEQIGTAPAKVTSTQGDATTYGVALLSMGAVAILLAANGLKLVKLSKTEAGFASAPGPSAVNEAKKSGDAPEKTVEVKDAESPEPEGEAVKTVSGEGVFKPEDIPIRVLADLSKEKPGAIETPADVEFGLHKHGKGNHPWYLKLMNGDTFKVAYGGQSKTGASVQQTEEK